MVRLALTERLRHLRQTLTASGTVSAHPRPTGAASNARIGLGRFRAMKKLLELLVCFLHPLAVVLM